MDTTHAHQPTSLRRAEDTHLATMLLRQPLPLTCHYYSAIAIDVPYIIRVVTLQI